MRIISGTWRNRKIIVPRGRLIRPTADRARETLFDILENSTLYSDWPLKNATILDIFAGTGALGIEALSRGAALAIFIDHDSQSIATVRANIETLGAGAQSMILQCDATRPFAARAAASVIFLDPPYNSQLPGKALSAFSNTKWFEQGALIVLETKRTEFATLPEHFSLIEERVCGNTKFWFYVYKTT